MDNWKDRPERVPSLERGDLETILALADTVPEDEGIRRLKAKVERSLSVYHWQDSLLEEARIEFEAGKNKSITHPLKGVDL